MRRLITLFLVSALSVVLAPSAVHAGVLSDFKEIFARYEGADGCRSVSLGHTMLKMMVNDARGKVGDGSGMFDGIETIMSLTVPDDYPCFIDEIKDYVGSDDRFRPVSSKTSSDSYERSWFFNGNVAGERKDIFLLLNHADDRTTVIFIYGRFDLKSVTKLPEIVR